MPGGGQILCSAGGGGPSLGSHSPPPFRPRFPAPSICALLALGAVCLRGLFHLLDFLFFFSFLFFSLLLLSFCPRFCSGRDAVSCPGLLAPHAHPPSCSVSMTTPQPRHLPPTPASLWVPAAGLDASPGGRPLPSPGPHSPPSVCMPSVPARPSPAAPHPVSSVTLDFSWGFVFRRAASFHRPRHAPQGPSRASRLDSGAGWGSGRPGLGDS